MYLSHNVTKFHRCNSISYITRSLANLTVSFYAPDPFKIMTPRHFADVRRPHRAEPVSVVPRVPGSHRKRQPRSERAAADKGIARFSPAPLLMF